MLGPRQKQLVDALRSGKFMQGTERLQSFIGDGAEYCCLGVACKVAEKNNIRVVYDSDGKLLGENLSEQDSVKNWFSFMGCKGENLKSFGNDLTDLNDNARLNFAQIADFIEENAHIIFMYSI